MTEEQILHRLERSIKYIFQDISLLRTALTHSSYCNEHRRDGQVSNERSEFLGDSVLSIITAEFLYNRFPDANEGFLTSTRAALVCEDSLAMFSNSLKLNEYMYFGKGEAVNNGGKNRKSIIADVFEAVIAAIYLDGGMVAAKKFVLPFITERLEEVSKTGSDDYKSRLLRIAQQTPEEALNYTLIKEEGPPHNRVFYYEVYLNSNLLGRGKGRTKREAEQAAAKEALVLLGELDEKAP